MLLHTHTGLENEGRLCYKNILYFLLLSLSAVQSVERWWVVRRNWGCTHWGFSIMSCLISISLQVWFSLLILDCLPSLLPSAKADVCVPSVVLSLPTGVVLPSLLPFSSPSNWGRFCFSVYMGVNAYADQVRNTNAHTMQSHAPSRHQYFFLLYPRTSGCWF